MARPMLHILMVGLVSVALPLATASSQEMESAEQPSPWDDVVGFVENSAFVWLEEPDEKSELEAMPIKELAEQFEGSILFEGGFLVQIKPADVRQRMQEVRKPLENERALPKVRSIEPNRLVYGFASGCGDPEPLPITQILPTGVERVNGPIAGPFTSRVWIIDSGIAGDFDGTELNVNRSKSVECNPVNANRLAIRTTPLKRTRSATGPCSQEPSAPRTIRSVSSELHLTLN